jgi:hypothetical protein
MRCYRTAVEMVACLCMLEVEGSTLGPKSAHHKRFILLSSGPPGKCLDSTEVIIYPSQEKTFPINRHNKRIYQ